MIDNIQKNKLQEAGIDVDSALERLLDNMQLYQSFLIKFLDDTNMEKLIKAVEEENTQQAFEAAHSLKGLCGNLSLIRLQDVVSQQTELLRSGNLKEASKLMPEIVAEYQKVALAIREMEG